MLSTLVVGAGPAGATAARTLAAAGARVTLLDRHRFPRNKPCGGAISMRVLGRFPYLRTALSRISTHQISRLHLEGPAGESVTLRSETPAALMIRRVEFDDLLVRLAVEAGAELIEDVDITQAVDRGDAVEVIARDGRAFSAPVVIAADGVNSVVARRLGLNTGWPARFVALDMMEETPLSRLKAVDPECLWVAYGYGGSHGYAYIFPKRAHVNVGIGYVLSYYRDHVALPPYDLQRAFIDELRDRDAIAGDSSRENFTPFLIPVGGPLRTTAAGRVLLAGDAGGFVNGFTAEGIYYAMVSGELAADAVLGAATQKGSDRDTGVRKALARYPDAWRREIGAELRDSVIVQRFLFHDSARIDAMIDGARRWPGVPDRLIAYAMGRVSYRAARRHLVTRFPVVAAKLLLAAVKPFRQAAGPTAVGSC